MLTSYADTLTPVEIRVGNVSNFLTAPNAVNANELCYSYLAEGNIGGSSPFPDVSCVNGALQGRYLSIQRTGTWDYFSLCDVKVGATRWAGVNDSVMVVGAKYRLYV